MRDNAIEHPHPYMRYRLPEARRREALGCQHRRHEREQRDLAGRWQAEARSAPAGDVGIERDVVAERVKLARQVENMKSPAGNDGHSHYDRSSSST
jgi:hypothetical protein